MRFIAILLLNILAANHLAASEDTKDTFGSLAQKIPSKPKVLSADDLSLMKKVAASKSLEAALVLIRCLAFQLDPDVSNGENLTGPSLLPAIGLLQLSFGKSVGPLLFVEGISTDKEWMRERCALAVRSIVQVEDLEKMIKIFSLETSIEQNSKKWNALLKQKEIHVDFSIKEDLKLPKK